MAIFLKPEHRLHTVFDCPDCPLYFFIFLFLFIHTLINPAPVYAMTAESRGVGCRAMGMGGAFTAVADDSFAAFYNPAGLAQLDGHHFDVDFLFVDPHVYLKTGQGQKTSALDKDVKGFFLGMVIDYSKAIKMSRKFVFAWNIYFPDFSKTAWKGRYGSQRYDPYYPLYGGDMHEEENIKIWVGSGFEVFPWLLIGGGVEVMMHAPSCTMQIAFDLFELEMVAEQSKIDPFPVTVEIYPTAGMLLKPFSKLRLGFTWRRGGYLTFKEGMTTKTKISLGDDPDDVLAIPDGLVFFDLQIFMGYFPTQYAFGASYNINDDLLVAADFTHYGWSSYRDNANRFPNPPMKDIFVPRIGLEYFLREKLALRTGYSFQASPVRQQKMGNPVNYIDNDVHNISFGLGYTWQFFDFPKKPAELSIFYQFHFLATRTLHNVHAGAQNTLESSGHFHSFGFGLNFKL